jgi:hypothetical protein
MALANAGLAYFVVLLNDWRRWIGVMVGTVLVAFGLWRGLGESTAIVAGESAYRQTNLDFLAKFANPNAGCVLVYYYDTPVKDFKLLFGNVFANRRYSQQLAALYPNFISYNPGVRLFETFGDGMLTATQVNRLLSHEKCVHLVGSNLERFGGDFGIPPESMTFVAHALGDPGAVAVYQLRLPLVGMADR